MKQLVWVYYVACILAVAFCAHQMLAQALVHQWLYSFMFAVAGAINWRNLVEQHQQMFRR